ncbi:MAG: LysR family transcriptional regulator [Paracoccaceae bacterium]
MKDDLPSPLLRSFVAVVEGGSLARAAVRVGRSESALSLQMGRLEALVGQPLFDREGRGLRLNQTGSLLLGHARAILERIDRARAELGDPGAPGPVRIGVVQDFAEPLLADVLAGVRAAFPTAQFEILVDGTAALLTAMSEDRIDTAVFASDVMAGDSGAELRMRWFGDPELARLEVVPLVSVSPPCPYFEAARGALERDGRAWRLAVVTPSLEGVRAAVAAGLGIACRTVPGLRLPALADDGGLPGLPNIRYALTRRRGLSPAQELAARELAAGMRRIAAEDSAASRGPG